MDIKSVLRLSVPFVFLLMATSRAEMLDCNNVATIHLTLNVKLDRNSSTIPSFNARDLNTASHTSNLQTKLYVLDSLGNSRPVWIFFSKTFDRLWRYYLVTEGIELANYSRTQSKDGLIILEQGLLQFFKDGKPRKIVPQHIIPKNFLALKAGEQSVQGELRQYENQASIRWKGAEPIDHIQMNFGQHGLLPGKILESDINSIESVEPTSNFDRYCPPEYLHDPHPSGRISE
jgi:hypothetical protein